MLHNSPQPPASPDESSVLFTMKMVADRAEVMFNAMKEKGLELPTQAQGRVLMYLKSRQGGPVSQRELEQHLGVTHSTAKGLVQRLEDKGFVRTAFDSEDGRVKHIYLGEYSNQLHEAAQRHVQRIEEQLLQGLDAGERALLEALLRRVFCNVFSETCLRTN